MKEFNGFLHNAPTVEKPPELRSYASGDGSLSFVYIDNNDKATGQKVTLAQAVQHLIDNFKDYEDWTVQEINGKICLVRKIIRINGFTLKIKDKLYRYSVNLATLGNMSQVAGHDLEIRVFNYTCAVIAWDKVINYNVIAAIKFFLNHEEEFK